VALRGRLAARDCATVALSPSAGRLLVVALVVVLGAGGFLGARALTGGGAAGPSAAEGSGEIFSPPDKAYSVEIPKGVVKVPTRTDSAIPSTTDLSLELEGKVAQGGLIKTGTLSGPAAAGTFDEIGDEAAKKYSDQYEGHPDEWGQGAAVDKKTITLGGRHAVAVSAKFAPSGTPEPSVFFRVYFVDAKSGPPILITCDWNASVTADIATACDTLVASFKAPAAPTDS
jgi:hypothetical protein